MAYKSKFSSRAQAEIDQFAEYLTAYSPAISERIMEELAAAIALHILPRPTMWPYFYMTGAPYRAYLFRAGRRTVYWVVYQIDEVAEVVNILRFWNASRDPETFE